MAAIFALECGSQDGVKKICTNKFLYSRLLYISRCVSDLRPLSSSSWNASKRACFIVNITFLQKYAKVCEYFTK